MTAAGAQTNADRDSLTAAFASVGKKLDDYTFPETLVNAFIAPAESPTMAGAPACEACGLRAPRYHGLGSGGDGFGCCPACFCPTTQAANDASGPVAESQPMAEKHRWPRTWRRGA